MITIALAEDRNSISRCFPVMRQLRPHIPDIEAFATQVQRQMDGHGYKLAFLSEQDEVAAVAGFRIFECLAWGRACYVDDLVTDDSRRSAGHGKRLLDWLIDFARQEGCAQFHLDSGVHRAGAHRFYFRNGMTISSFHFALPIDVT